MNYADFRPLLLDILEEGVDSLEHIERSLLQGSMQFWAKDGSGIITEIMDYRGGAKVLQTVAAAGELEPILNMIPVIEAWAKDRGCTMVLIQGRPGWVKTLKSHGYSLNTVALKKAL